MRVRVPLGAPFTLSAHHEGDGPIVDPMPKPEKKPRGRPPEELAMTPQQAAETIDRMLGKRPASEQPAQSDDAPRVKSKRPKK